MMTFDVKEMNERIIPTFGLAIIGAMLNKFRFVKRFNAVNNLMSCHKFTLIRWVLPQLSVLRIWSVH